MPLRGDSAAVGRSFSSPVGFVFVDGDHSEAGVAADIEAWFPRLVPGAFVAFHDISWATGVQTSFARLAEPRLRAIERLPNLVWGRYAG